MVTHRDECVQRLRHIGVADDGLTKYLRTSEGCTHRPLGSELTDRDFRHPNNHMFNLCRETLTALRLPGGDQTSG